MIKRLGVPVLYLCVATAMASQDAAPNDGQDSAQNTAEQSQVSTKEPVVATTSSSFTLEEKPRFEFGVGGGYIDGFDYPASNDPNQRSIVLPYFIYRSPRLRVGGGGVNAIAVENPRVKLDWSIAGSLSSASEDNSARAGLPNLDYLFEIGPQLVVNLYDRQIPGVGRVQSQFSAKLRAVFSTDFSSVDSQGFVAASTWRLNLRAIKGTSIGVFGSLTSTYAAEEIQDYYYEVAPGFENADRAIYNASAGYLGTSISLALGSNIHPNVRVFTGVNFGLFAGAKNQSSPLFETTQSTGFGVGIIWAIKRSNTTVPVLVSNQ
ncbi:MAG: MipA/OmpV family protein [Gammaproteobacteria bacterium]|nr:MipA/OmpV family protein [Gammaproteobacteria bacterium]